MDRRTNVMREDALTVLYAHEDHVTQLTDLAVDQDERMKENRGKKHPPAECSRGSCHAGEPVGRCAQQRVLAWRGLRPGSHCIQAQNCTKVIHH